MPPEVVEPDRQTDSLSELRTDVILVPTPQNEEAFQSRVLVLAHIKRFTDRCNQSIKPQLDGVVVPGTRSTSAADRRSS